MRERRLLYLPRLSVHPYTDGDGLAIATEYRGGLADADFHPRSPTGARGGPSGCRYRRRSRPRRGVRPRSLRDDRRLSRDSFRFRRALSLPCVRTHERRQYGVSEVMPLCVRVPLLRASVPFDGVVSAVFRRPMRTVRSVRGRRVAYAAKSRSEPGSVGPVGEDAGAARVDENETAPDDVAPEQVDERDVPDRTGAFDRPVKDERGQRDSHAGDCREVIQRTADP